MSFNHLDPTFTRVLPFSLPNCHLILPSVFSPAHNPTTISHHNSPHHTEQPFHPTNPIVHLPQHLKPVTMCWYLYPPKWPRKTNSHMSVRPGSPPTMPRIDPNTGSPRDNIELNPPMHSYEQPRQNSEYEVPKGVPKRVPVSQGEGYGERKARGNAVCETG